MILFDKIIRSENMRACVCSKSARLRSHATTSNAYDKRVYVARF